LEVLGGTWRYLEVLGGTWRYLEVLGGTWKKGLKKMKKNEKMSKLKHASDII
jgi:hypothetical protein